MPLESRNLPVETGLGQSSQHLDAVGGSRTRSSGQEACEKVSNLVSDGDSHLERVHVVLVVTLSSRHVVYTLEQYKGDLAEVYAMGGSSGAMMTNVLAGSYLDVFEAGAAFLGTRHACFAGAAAATPVAPNQTCAQDRIKYKAQQWGDFVRNSHPGYRGRRTGMQIFHGMADGLVRPGCAEQTLLQWSNVLRPVGEERLGRTLSSV